MKNLNKTVKYHPESVDPDRYTPVIHHATTADLKATSESIMPTIAVMMVFVVLALKAALIITGFETVYTDDGGFYHEFVPAPVETYLGYGAILAFFTATAIFEYRSSFLASKRLTEFTSINRKALTKWLNTYHGIIVPNNLTLEQQEKFDNVANMLMKAGSCSEITETLVLERKNNANYINVHVKTFLNKFKQAPEQLSVRNTVPYSKENAKKLSVFNKHLKTVAQFILTAEEEHLVERVKSDMGSLMVTLNKMETLKEKAPSFMGGTVDALIKELEEIIARKKNAMAKTFEAQANWINTRK